MEVQWSQVRESSVTFFSRDTHVFKDPRLGCLPHLCTPTLVCTHAQVPLAVVLCNQAAEAPPADPLRSPPPPPPLSTFDVAHVWAGLAARTACCLAVLLAVSDATLGSQPQARCLPALLRSLLGSEREAPAAGSMCPGGCGSGGDGGGGGARCWAAAVYGLPLTFADLTPNIGQWWYLFAQVWGRCGAEGVGEGGRESPRGCQVWRCGECAPMSRVWPRSGHHADCAPQCQCGCSKRYGLWRCEMQALVGCMQPSAKLLGQGV
eukprot:354351-Chlamydomonas_euryale.AAC.3